MRYSMFIGRFQPFHFGHAAVYKHLVGKFGKNNVFIGTSNKQGGPRHPFNFKEKKEIMKPLQIILHLMIIFKKKLDILSQI